MAPRWTQPKKPWLEYVLIFAAGAAMLWASRAQSAPQKLPPEMTTQIDKIFEKWNRTDTPGCALGVYKDGAIVYEHGYGMANLNDDVTITPETVFHVASMSKQFTDASIVLLAQQGKLSLDDDIHKYLPELADFGQRITIKNLIFHTSGLRDQWELLELAGWRYSSDLITDDDVMSVVTRQKHLNFKPGDKWMYSNTGYTLLALIVKRVSGMSLHEFTTKNIFEPLSMTHTHFRDDHEEIIKHDALGYEQEDQGGKGGKDKPFRMDLTNFDTTGATSLHTTVEDLQLWDENFYHPRVGGPALVSQMLEQGKLNNGEQLDYAFGLVVGDYRGLKTVNHSGGDAGYRSNITRFPDQHFSASVLCNAAEADPWQMVLRVADAVLAKEMKAPEHGADAAAVDNAPPLTADQMNALTGLYWDKDRDNFERILVKDGKLQLGDPNGDETTALQSTGNGHFRLADQPLEETLEIHFVETSAGTPRRFEQHAPRAKKANMFEAVTPFQPAAAQLIDYEGNYVSEEIDPVYRVSVEDGKLTLLYLKHKSETLHPLVRDTFVGDIGKLRFTRDAKGRVTGLTLDTGRIQNFTFTKKAS